MDKVQLDYKDAYQKYNGRAIKITKRTQIRYYIQSDFRGFTAKQIEGFTQTLRKNVE